MKSITPPGHLTFQTLQQLLFQRILLQKVAEITPAIKGIIQAVMKELQRADHAIIEIRMTHTANEDSPGIYTLGDRRREREREDFPTEKRQTLLEKRKKKRSNPKNSVNPLPQTSFPL